MTATTRSSRGFTLIELLVALAVIGFLLTIGVYSIGVVRQKSRDSKRVANIKEIQKGLELYYGEKQGYPVASSLVLGGASAQALTAAGFTASGAGSGTVFIGIMPRNITPGGSDFLYSSLEPDGGACSAAPCDNYNITFNLEKGTGSMPEGNHLAHPGGID